LIATKAVRACRAADSQPFIEFSVRRAQGADPQPALDVVYKHSAIKHHLNQLCIYKLKGLKQIEKTTDSRILQVKKFYKKGILAADMIDDELGAVNCREGYKVKSLFHRAQFSDSLTLEGLLHRFSRNSNESLEDSSSL
jgi:nicotinic acid phosphoribosyltransferase